MKCPACQHEWKNSKQGRPAKVDRGKVVELRNQGMGWKDIAKALGCSRVAAQSAFKGIRRVDRIPPIKTE